ncbi:restriction endonuclease subunit S [Pediococcus pentosaceus]|uniref:restriction endonuclease subunit S n=1 Tax=Pediococcus pentosaceus TaxID=1255 RepID=UPI0020183CFB|nr:restriction endonuclease subunit S [Pediococcus pentosaceus]MCL3859047.1 restriction endonuclease subunit S [Pediococcus pentosaceus]
MSKNKKQLVPARRFKEFENADDWVQRKLGDIINVNSGRDYKHLNKGDIPVYGTGGYMLSVDKFLSDKNAVGIGRKGTINKPYVLYAPFWTVDTLFYTIPKTENDLFFISDIFQKINWLSKAESTGVPSLSKKTINNIKVYVPTFKEQQAIGSLFKKIDDLIVLQQRKLDKLKRVKAAYLTEMFPAEGEREPKRRFPGFTGAWVLRKLGDIGSVLMNKRIFKNETTSQGEIPFYKIGTFGGKADAFISKALFSEYKNKYPYPKIGDLLISASGSIGRIVEYTGKAEYFQDSNIVWLDHDETISNKFLKQFYNIVRWQGLEGGTIKRLYNKNILSTEIRYPNISEQEAIGSLFQKIDDLIALHQRKLDKLKKMKAAYLNEMFV